jgi:hypothetical protein
MTAFAAGELFALARSVWTGMSALHFGNSISALSSAFE